MQLIECYAHARGALPTRSADSCLIDEWKFLEIKLFCLDIVYISLPPAVSQSGALWMPSRVSRVAYVSTVYRDSVNKRKKQIQLRMIRCGRFTLGVWSRFVAEKKTGTVEGRRRNLCFDVRVLR